MRRFFFARVFLRSRTHARRLSNIRRLSVFLQSCFADAAHCLQLLWLHFSPSTSPSPQKHLQEQQQASAQLAQTMSGAGASAGLSVRVLCARMVGWRQPFTLCVVVALFGGGPRLTTGRVWCRAHAALTSCLVAHRAWTATSSGCPPRPRKPPPRDHARCSRTVPAVQYPLTVQHS